MELKDERVKGNGKQEGESKSYWSAEATTTAKRFSSTIYKYTGLSSRVAEFQKTMIILPPFQPLVKDFKYRLPLQKADRIVGLIPLWLTCIIPLWPHRQADTEAVHRVLDSPPASLQNMGVNDVL